MGCGASTYDDDGGLSRHHEASKAGRRSQYASPGGGGGGSDAAAAAARHAARARASIAPSGGAQASASELPLIPWASLKQHSTPSSVWVAVHGRVYDVTGFIARHPGGAAAILDVAGGDASAAFDGAHPYLAPKLRMLFPAIGVVPPGPAPRHPALFAPPRPPAAAEAVVKPSSLSGALKPKKGTAPPTAVSGRSVRSSARSSARSAAAATAAAAAEVGAAAQ